MPVNPGKISIERAGNNSKVEVVELGYISILKSPDLRITSLEGFCPRYSNDSYVVTKGKFEEPEFYMNFFNKIQDDKKPLTLIITGLNINLSVTIESFIYEWAGGCKNMDYTLELQEYRPHKIKVAQLVNNPLALSSNSTTNQRENTTQNVTIGCTVIVNGRLHRDSYGKGPGKTETNARRKVNFINLKGSHPYHVTLDDGGWRGWVEKSAVRVVS